MSSWVISFGNPLTYTLVLGSVGGRGGGGGGGGGTLAAAALLVIAGWIGRPSPPGAPNPIPTKSIHGHNQKVSMHAIHT